MIKSIADLRREGTKYGLEQFHNELMNPDDPSQIKESVRGIRKICEVKSTELIISRHGTIQKSHMTIPKAANTTFEKDGEDTIMSVRHDTPFGPRYVKFRLSPLKKTFDEQQCA